MVNNKVPHWLRSNIKDEDCLEIKEFIVELEKHTSGEVVPMVVKSSSTLGHVPYIVLLSLTLLDVISGFWAFNLEANWAPLPIIIVTHIIFILLLTLILSRFNFVQRQLTPKTDQSLQVENRAINEFYKHKIHHTKDKTGILIFISMMERMAVVIGDEKINEKLSPSDWKKVLDKILFELKSGKLKVGILKGLDESKNLLSLHFPIEKADKNEISNNLIIKE
ncbi:MAG: TPM domain-containing protein [Bdellovibrionaceae bacterium]|nr:TPM domain-containing protein [Pseudobdellovibrionaceae bacterium]